MKECLSLVDPSSTRANIRHLQVLSSLGFDDISRFDFLPGGYNSDVIAIVTSGRERVSKLIGGKKNVLTREEAEELAKDIRTYQALLEETGMRIAPLEDIKLHYNLERGGSEILQISGHHGASVESVFRDGDDTAVTGVLRMMLEQLHFIFARLSADGDLSVGIDPKPGNFTRDELGQLWFVDTMPPRFRKDGHALVEYPAPKTRAGYEVGYRRHFTVAGVLLVLQTQTCRLNPRYRHIVKREIDAFVAEHFPQAHMDLSAHDARVQRVVAGRQIDDIAVMTEEQVYLMREIACEIAYQNGHDGWLDRLFVVTHFEDGVHPHHLEEAKRLLRGVLTQAATAEMP